MVGGCFNTYASGSTLLSITLSLKPASLPHGHRPHHTDQQVQELFGPELWRSAGWRSRFSRGFSLVLACHPDQATEPALEYALEEGLPFAIVPCCVFPRLFAHRRLVRGGGDSGSSNAGGCGSSSVGGDEVLTYSNLVDYIAERGQAQRAVLGFEGANTVVYRGATAAAAAVATEASAHLTAVAAAAGSE